MKTNLTTMLLGALLLFTPNSKAVASSQFEVGMSAIDIEPAIGIPLAGYGATERRLPGFIDWRNDFPHAFFFRPSIGRIDPIRAKTMAIRRGGKTLIFVSLDTIGVEFTLISDLLKNLKPYNVKREDLFVTGTHTHSGPGTLSKRIPLQLIAVDFFKRQNYEYIRAKTLQSILIALDRLEPATLYKTKFDTNNIQRNKWRKKDQNYFNNTAYLLVAKNAKGRLLGGIVNYAVHGGALDADNLKYSADLPGGIERALEDDFVRRNTENSENTDSSTTYRPVFAFFNGAEGDVGAKHGGVEGIAKGSKLFVEQAQLALDHGLQELAPVLKSATRKIWFGIPRYPIIDLKKGAEGQPTWRKIDFPFPGLMPGKAYLSQAMVGDIVMMSYPGEASTTLGYELQAHLRTFGAVDPWVIGLTNDYMGYFTSHDEYFEGTYDSRSSIYGWKAARRVKTGHENLYMKMMSGSEGSTTLQ